MLSGELLTGALMLLGEIGDAEYNPDYSERAPYIIAAFVGETFRLDARYRLAYRLENASIPDRVCIGLDEKFPLVEPLAPLCTLYLASLLIADESPELSEKFYDRYCDGISAFSDSIPSVKESIKDVYR